MDENIEQEVAEAMAGMSSEDLAELTGGAGAPAPPPQSPESIATGSDMVGTIVGVTEEDVFLDLGTNLQGVLPRGQFGKKESLDAGRRVDVVVERYDADLRLLLVNRKGQLDRATWTNLAPGMVLEGRVTGMNKGGLELDLKGVRAFMPASQVDIVPVKDISVLLNTSVRFEVLEVDRRHKNVLVSRRKLLERERAEARERIFAELTNGQVRKGVVTNTTEYGAFVDLGGIDGLIHISDMSWGTVEKVTDVVSPGQEVEVKVLKVDRERERISLGLKQVTQNPWSTAAERYPVGTALKVRVLRLANFGAFAELEPGLEGLIPVSEMSWTHVRNPSDAVKTGDMVDAVVIRVEADKRKLALSMKQATPDPWAEVVGSFPAQSIVTGKVMRLTDFGAFLELAPGVEGLVHVSEIADRRVRTPADVLTVGQEVQVRVLGVDRDQRRMSLSIKAVHHQPEHTAAAAAASGPQPAKKQRKKPLRGGVEWGWQ